MDSSFTEGDLELYAGLEDCEERNSSLEARSLGGWKADEEKPKGFIRDPLPPLEQILTCGW